MAIKFEIDKHAYCFPTKVLAGNGGEHILNIDHILGHYVKVNE